ncbi:hypothetical protein ACOMHN_027800 [Nucella lapillus]
MRRLAMMTINYEHMTDVKMLVMMSRSSATHSSQCHELCSHQASLPLERVPGIFSFLKLPSPSLLLKVPCRKNVRRLEC